MLIVYLYSGEKLNNPILVSNQAPKGTFPRSTLRYRPFSQTMGVRLALSESFLGISAISEGLMRMCSFNTLIACECSTRATPLLLKLYNNSAAIYTIDDPYHKECIIVMHVKKIVTHCTSKTANKCIASSFFMKKVKD